MTKEEAIKILVQIRQWTDYPKEALTMAIEALSQPSLPSNLDEAAEEESQHAYGEPTAQGFAKRSFFKRGFKAGAEWMAGQGVIVTGEYVRILEDIVKSLLILS
jgi:hypothetical protein